MVRFMFNHVVPATRQMVGGEPYDAETGEGFGCFDCHTHAQSAPAPDADLQSLSAEVAQGSHVGERLALIQF